MVAPTKKNNIHCRGCVSPPAFVCDNRLFLGGGKQTPLRYVANLLRKNCPSPTKTFITLHSALCTLFALYLAFVSCVFDGSDEGINRRTR
jgi:hypothetical protein